MTRYCPICKTGIIKRKDCKTCSWECGVEYRGDVIHARSAAKKPICPECGINQVLRKGRKFCSQDCMKSYKSKTNKEFLTKLARKQVKTPFPLCRQCKINRVNWHGCKYCSDKCYKNSDSFKLQPFKKRY